VVVGYLRKPVQREGRVENIHRPRRKKPPVERTGDAGGEVGAVVVGGKAFFHADAVVGERRKELKECVEVIAGKVREES